MTKGKDVARSVAMEGNMLENECSGATIENDNSRNIVGTMLARIDENNRCCKELKHICNLGH